MVLQIKLIAKKKLIQKSDKFYKIKNLIPTNNTPTG